MVHRQIYRFAGWCAYLSGVAALLTLVTVPTFMAIGLPHDLISNVTEIIWFALIIPIAVAFHLQLRFIYGWISFALLLVGIVGLAYSTVVTFLIDFGPAGVGDDGVFLTTTIGIWFLITSFLLLMNKLQPSGLSVLGILIGISHMMGLLGLLFVEALIILFGIHVLVLSLLYPIWAVWTGHILLKLKSDNPLVQAKSIVV